jgi:hypothetical protein
VFEAREGRILHNVTSFALFDSPRQYISCQHHINEGVQINISETVMSPVLLESRPKMFQNYEIQLKLA